MQTTFEERFGKCPHATAQSLISGKYWIHRAREEFESEESKAILRRITSAAFKAESKTPAAEAAGVLLLLFFAVRV